jgi:hypothetical protein
MSHSNWMLPSSKTRHFLISSFIGFIGIVLFIVGKNTALIFGTYLSLTQLGQIFFVGSFLYYAFVDQISLEVDEKNSLVIFHRKNILERKLEKISFNEFKSIQVKKIGRTNDSIHSFHLVLKLKNDRSIFPGFVSTDISEISEIAEKLSVIMGCSFEQPQLINQTHTRKTFFALLLSILIYAFWYRFKVGPWCPAMWGGSAPLVIITSVFFIIHQALKRV